MPVELDEVTRRVMLLEIEEAALQKEEDEQSKKRLEDLKGIGRNARERNILKAKNGRKKRKTYSGSGKSGNFLKNCAGNGRSGK